ncbi:MAG: type II secretion system protein GspG [Acidobacteriota bacterium]
MMVARPRSWVAPAVFACGIVVAAALITMDQLPLPRRPSADETEAYERGIRDISRLRTAVEQYLRETGDLPSQIEDLIPKYLTAVPQDPWGRRYGYRRLDDRAFVTFLGRDGESGPRVFQVDRDVVAVIERRESQ